MKLGMDEELKVPHMFEGILTRSTKGQNRLRLGGFLKNLFFRSDGFSNKPNA